MAEQKKAIAVELTDGFSTKPVMLGIDSVSIQDVLKLAKNKLRKSYKFCLLYNKKTQYYGKIQNDDDLKFVLQQQQDQQQGCPPCLYFTNKLPEDAQDLNRQEEEQQQNNCCCFVIGNAADCEDAAIQQLKCASRLPGVRAAIGMPDLHAGKGIPIGAAVITNQDTAYPQLVDSDIGCGMSFVETSLSTGKLTANKLHKIAEQLESIDVPYSNDIETMKELCSHPLTWASKQVNPLLPDDLPSDEHYMNLGTIGGGNHFAEFQEFQDILDAETLQSYGIDTTKVHLLVHSGSRSLGAAYITDFCEQAKRMNHTVLLEKRYGHYAVQTDSPLFQKYLQNHDTALNFAVRNRKLIAKRLLDQVSSSSSSSEGGVCKIDIHHNFMENIPLNQLDVLHQMAQEQGMFPKRIVPTTTTTTSAASPDDPHPKQEDKEEEAPSMGWIHRKGATPTTQSPILVIPGSRGSLSYLVEVNAEAVHGSAYSLAHGAGRQMTRSKARSMNAQRHPRQNELLQTSMGGVVVCDKKDLVYEEAPGAYKDVDRVVRCLAQEVVVGEDDDEKNSAGGNGLVRILATLRPILTYKYKDPYK